MCSASSGSMAHFRAIANFPTIADRLDTAGVTWKYYASPLRRIGGKVWSEFSSIRERALRARLEQCDFAADADSSRRAASAALADVSWVTPTGSTPTIPAAAPIVDRRGLPRSSTRLARVGTGNRRRSSCCGTIGAAGTITFRRRSSISVASAFAFPCIVISPYAKRGYVSHTQYEYGSILKFVEEVFNLAADRSGVAGLYRHACRQHAR